METAKTIQSVRSLVKAARSQGKTVALVPTMGALHVGHISLIEKAAQQCDFVVVSIFVNPAQFSPDEDLEKYPRPIDADLKICEKAGADLVFNPTPAEIYPTENITWVNVEKLTDQLCGRSRPGHFRGVTTVCAKLFNITRPDTAYFGQKDAQQALVIRKMVSDLNMPLEIVICPTIREPDGLAISSRNQYLNGRQRSQAPQIYRSLQRAREMIENGTIDSQTIITEMRKEMEKAGPIDIEYINIAGAETLTDIETVTGKVLIAVAAGIGSTRLIDNILVDAGEK